MFGRLVGGVSSGVGRVGSGVSSVVDDVVDILDVIEIVPYISYATGGNVRVLGRVQENRAAHPFVATPSSLGKAAYLDRGPQQAVSAKEVALEIYPDPKPNAEVEINVNGYRHVSVTDKHGYYDCTFPGNLPIQVVTGTVTLKKLKGKPAKPVTVSFPIVVSDPSKNRFGVISDIDDTILQSDVTNPMFLFYNTVFQNPQRRKPTTGTLDFYHTLHNGFAEETNPFFYISNSPWTLYRRLRTFIEHKQFPLGPILLRELSVAELQNSMHKKTTITRILADFPHLQFVLIGDSGEKDLQIYQVWYIVR